MTIRPFNTETDSSAVLKLFELNTPEFFHSSEKADLESYLKKEIEDYFVIEENGELIGSGGVNYFLEKNRAYISWDIIHPSAQGKGVGSFLVQHRLAILKELSAVSVAIVRTSQLVYKFYEKQGFELKEVKKDYWSPGYDLYFMEKSVK